MTEMRKSAEDAIPIIERVYEEISHASWSAPQTAVAFHIDPARQQLETTFDGSTSGELSEERAERIEQAARHLAGIQSPADLRAKALEWAKTLRGLL